MHNFSAIAWREQVTFLWDDDDVHFVQDQHPLMLWVDMSLNTDTVS